MSDRRFCNKPDRDVPGIICGHPLPCLYHTAVIDLSNPLFPVSNVERFDSNERKKLKEIAEVLIRGDHGKKVK